MAWMHSSWYSRRMTGLGDRGGGDVDSGGGDGGDPALVLARDDRETCLAIA